MPEANSGKALSRTVQLYPGGAEPKPCTYGEPFAPLPTSWVLCGPTGSGKTIGMLNLILKFYKGAFDRIFVVSPSISLDSQYKVLREHLEKMCDQKKEKLYFEDWDHQAIGTILDTQRAIVESCRKRKVPAPHILLVLDDMGDYTDIMQARRGAKIGGSWMTTLATKGRHFQVSWLVTCQKFNQIGRIIRSNARNLLVWRQRNAKEVETLCEELSGWYDKATVMALYEYATAEPYSWLTIRLDAKKPEDAFWLRFEKRLVPQSADAINDAGSGVHVGESVPGPPGRAVAKHDSGSSSSGGSSAGGRGAGKGAKARGGNPRGPGLRGDAKALRGHKAGKSALRPPAGP